MRSQINTAIARAAHRRKGLVTREQLLAIGLTRGQIDTRVQGKALIPDYDGIYRVGHCAPNLETSYLAAVLACGKGTSLSGGAASYLYGLIKGKPPPPEVTTPSQRRPHGVICHRTRRVSDATTYRGIPITTVARTVVDMAPGSTPAELAEQFHHAVVKFRVKPHHVEAVLKRRPNSKGAKALRRVMNGDERVLLSELERGFIALLREHNLPLPKTNIPRGGHWVTATGTSTSSPSSSTPTASTPRATRGSRTSAASGRRGRRVAASTGDMSGATSSRSRSRP
jgi:hypothetical protein